MPSIRLALIGTLEPILLALAHEAKATVKKAAREAIKAVGATLVSTQQQGPAIYSTKVKTKDRLEQLDDQCSIRLGFGDLDPPWIRATPLSIDRKGGHLLFETQQPLPDTHLGKPFDALSCEDDLVRAVSDAIDRVKDCPELLAWELVSEDFEPKAIKAARFTRKTKLDRYQIATIDHALSHDITLLIGPPATGKTSTLAELIVEYVLRGYRVLVVSIANVAVDHIVLRTVQALEKLGNRGTQLLDDGQILRFGHAVLPEVSQDRRLFPHLEVIDDLRSQLRDLITDLRKIPKKKSLERATVQRRINSIRSRIRDIQRDALSSAAVVFTTVIQTALCEDFAEVTFETVLADETSMMAMPYSVCSAICATKHIVLAGDPNQLPPVALATTPQAKLWMHRSIFDLHGMDHPSCVMLRSQRRMHKESCGLVNQTYYDGRLITRTPKSSLRGTELPPLPGRPIVLLSYSAEDGSAVERTPQQSRINRGSCDLVIKILELIGPSLKDMSVGVITAYRAQALLIREKIEGRPSCKDFRSNLRVGTVHTFQGSESDLIIWDIVDNSISGLGRPFKGRLGDRLSNVAITRAKGKLIVIADPSAFNVSSRTKTSSGLTQIMKKLIEDTSSIIRPSDLK